LPGLGDPKPLPVSADRMDTYIKSMGQLFVGDHGILPNPATQLLQALLPV